MLMMTNYAKTQRRIQKRICDLRPPPYTGATLSPRGRRPPTGTTLSSRGRRPRRVPPLVPEAAAPTSATLSPHGRRPPTGATLVY